MTAPTRRKKSGPFGAKIGKHSEYLSKRAVAPDVAKERGYQSVTTRATLTDVGISPAAPLPGLLIPILWNKKPVLHQYRPDEPRTPKGEDKPRKFERPKGRGNRLDCHPRVTPALADLSVPLLVTEGVVKGDALVTAGLCAVAVLGVDCWLTKADGGDSEPLDDWDDVALDGRLVVVAFDADCMTKPEVARARQALTVFLHLRGAHVKWLYLPEPAAKTGVDDYLAAENSVEDLWGRVQPPCFKIPARGGALPETTSEALAALALRNDPPTLFRRGRAVVEVNRASLGMEEVDRDRLKNRLARVGDWFTRDKGGNERPASPPDEVVKDAAVAYEEHRFPQLARVVTTPVFAGRPHFTLRTEPGYDTATQNLYIPPAGLDVPPVPERPTAKQARAAVKDLFDYISEFPFKSDADKAHALALLLQPFARDVIRGETPLYVAEAPTEGTGKGLLLKTLLAPGVGRLVALGPKTAESEIEKNVTTAFLESRPVVFFDNWPTDKQFASPSVASALTMEYYMSRVLGASKFVSAPNNVVWLLSGNNPKFSPEILRRVVRIRLDAEHEDPKSRSDFRYTLPADALANRAQMIHDACLVIRHWISIGRPGPGDDVPAFGSFAAWRYVLGGILGAADVPGFLSNVGGTASTDDDAATTEAAVFALIREALGVSSAFTAQTLLGVFDSKAPDLADEVIPEHTREGSRTRAVGSWLADHRDRVNDGHALHRLGRVAGGFRWHVEPV